MKTRMIAISAVAASLAAFQAPAFADNALATAKNCMACHAVDKKMVGPSYKEVAAKYGSDAGAAKMLAEKIQKGSTPGKGNWGPVPMPANPQVSEAEAAKLATWVLAQK
jgi:cytochrome c